MRNARVIALLLAAPASARSVYLNGINIDSVRNQALSDCEVRIDAEGNVLLHAKGYTVKESAGVITLSPIPRTPPANPYAQAPVSASTASPPAVAAPQAKPPIAAAPPMPVVASLLSKRYFVIAQTNRTGAVQYDIDVFVNSKWVKRLRGLEQQEIVEITSNLAPGENTVHLSAVKNFAGGQRASTSDADYLDVLVGLGAATGSTVEIKSILGRLRKSAAEVDKAGKEIPVTAE
ncbi:MAG: hypothetical protein AABZ30_14785 [Myxococcota bacterium]